jgi:KEOPS complex subunit Pcc1
MISKFNARIEIDAKEKTHAIFDSVNIDNKFYPENPTKTEISCGDKITILIEAEQLAQMRANLNSCIRLIQASYDSIESVDI